MRFEPDRAEAARSEARGIRVRELERLVGGLTRTSKMPGPSWSLPALVTCPVGRKLAQVPGTPCSDCYALKGNYFRPNVQAAQRRRLEIVKRDVSAWAGRMVHLLWSLTHTRQGPDGLAMWFRVHDSGDMFDPAYWEAWKWIARRLQDDWIRFWVPTQEPWVAGDQDVPVNMTVRRSLPKAGASMARLLAHAGERGLMSAVVEKGTPVMPGEWRCPAPQQGGKCGTCRACWVRRVPLVTYVKH